MNALGFFIGRFAWQLGITRERARWNAVTRETQQLAETQDLLGKLAWPSTASVERLSGEFWQITDLHKQQQALREQSGQLTAENDHAQDRLYGIEDAVVNLLVQHADGLSAILIAERLGLSETVIPAILNELVKSQRILAGAGGTYLDNPKRI